MKKIIALLWIMVFCTCSFFSFTAVFASERVAPESITIFYSQEGNYLPSLLKTGYEYSIDLYEKDDEDYSECLAESVNEGKFTFSRVGEYRLKYNLKNILTNEISVEYAMLKLVDNMKPIIVIDGSYEDFYVSGDKIKILDISTRDHSGTTDEYTVKVYRDDKDISQEINNGNLTLKKGKYKLIYNAIGLSGNETDMEVGFTTVGNTAELNSAYLSSSLSSNETVNQTPSIIVICVLSVSVIGLATVIILSITHRGAKKEEK